MFNAIPAVRTIATQPYHGEAIVDGVALSDGDRLLVAEPGGFSPGLYRWYHDRIVPAETPQENDYTFSEDGYESGGTGWIYRQGEWSLCSVGPSFNRLLHQLQRSRGAVVEVDLERRKAELVLRDQDTNEVIGSYSIV